MDSFLRGEPNACVTQALKPGFRSLQCGTDGCGTDNGFHCWAKTALAESDQCDTRRRAATALVLPAPPCMHGMQAVERQAGLAGRPVYVYIEGQAIVTRLLLPRYCLACTAHCRADSSCWQQVPRMFGSWTALGVCTESVSSAVATQATVWMIPSWQIAQFIQL